MNAKEKLLEAASQLFEQNGYSGTTTAAVALKAGVAEVTLFRHFKNKANLFRETIKRIQSSVDLNFVQENQTEDYKVTINHFSRSICRYFIEQSRTIRMMQFESIRNPELKMMLREGPLKILNQLEKLFTDLISSGTIRERDPRILAESLLSLIFGYAFALISLHDQQDINTDLNNLENIINTSFLPGLDCQRRNKNET